MFETLPASQTPGGTATLRAAEEIKMLYPVLDLILLTETRQDAAG
jgi:hypothetical protein